MRFPLHSHHKVFNLYINLWMFSCFALPKFIFKAKLCVCLCLKLLIVCAYCWLFIYLSISRNWESVCYVVNTGFLSICPLTVRTCSKSSSSWTLQKEAASRYNAQQCHTHTHKSQNAFNSVTAFVSLWMKRSFQPPICNCVSPTDVLNVARC